jgi:hypothetical protein
MLLGIHHLTDIVLTQEDLHLQGTDIHHTSHQEANLLIQDNQEVVLPIHTTLLSHILLTGIIQLLTLQVIGCLGQGQTITRTFQTSQIRNIRQNIIRRAKGHQVK